MMDKRYGERPPGYLGALGAHLAVILALPFFLLNVAYFAWGFEVSGFELSGIDSHFRFLQAVIPLAPLITYILYSWQRRKLETDREQEWARFQTMQALLFQVVVLLCWLVILPWWGIGSFPIGLMLYAVVIAMIVYGLFGAISMLIGKEDFSYLGIGRLARKIIQG